MARTGDFSTPFAGRGQATTLDPMETGTQVSKNRADATTAEDAAGIVPRYSCRWWTEHLHFTLQAGGNHVVDFQLESRERLERAIPLYSIVSWRPLRMTHQVRLDPNQSPTVAFSPNEIVTLERWFLERKRDGEPGAKTLWRGYRQWQLLCWWDEVSQKRA